MSTILVLESNRQTAELFQAQLEKQRYQVVVAENVAGAQRTLQSMIPDIFLIDLNVAVGAEFWDFYHFLRVDQSLQSIPRVFLCGKAQLPMVNEINKHGHDLILQKPLRMSQLLESLRRMTIPSTSLGGQQDLFASWIGRRIGSVEIQRELGRGGMGAVFEGLQPSLERKVAVKVMLPQLLNNPGALSRFQREALAIAKLKSPHVVQVFDAGFTEDGVFYIVMEFLEGFTLCDYLERFQRCTTSRAVEIVCQVLEGLTVAHGAGLLHRDLKPSNLMIDKSYHVTITDFGLVRPIKPINDGTQLTQDGSLLGTPYYLSPEQASGLPLGATSDLYSLGIVMYELLTGEPPFQGATLLEILTQHHRAPLPDPRQHQPEIPEFLVRVLEKMTAKDPNQRYSSASAVLQDLNLLRAVPSTDTQAAFQSTQVSASSASLSRIPSAAISAIVTPSGHSHSSFSMSGSLSQEGLSYIAPEDAIPVDVMKMLLKEYTKRIGPIAKVALKQETEKLGFSRKAFPRSHAAMLVEKLAQRMDPSKQEGFVTTGIQILSTKVE